MHKEWKKNNPETVKNYDKPKPEYFREWKAKNKERIHSSYINRRFKFLKSDYEKLLMLQNNRCAICGISQEDLPRKLAVDHCHKNKFVRGLLCFKCNTLLGLAKDNIETLHNAIKYLKNQGKQKDDSSKKDYKK